MIPNVDKIELIMYLKTKLHPVNIFLDIVFVLNIHSRDREINRVPQINTLLSVALHCINFILKLRPSVRTRQLSPFR